MDRFSGKVVLITGGGSGIGRATALAFAREGARVVVAGRRLPAVEETAALIQASGRRADAQRVDVTDDGEVAHLVEFIAEQHGRLDVAFNNAGILGTPGPLSQLSREAWSSVLETNLTGVWTCMKHEIAYMRNTAGA